MPPGSSGGLQETIWENPKTPAPPLPAPGPRWQKSRPTGLRGRRGKYTQSLLGTSPTAVGYDVLVLQALREILLETSVVHALETMRETLETAALVETLTRTLETAALAEMLTRKSKVQCGDVTGVAVAGGDVTGVATTHAHVSAPFCMHTATNGALEGPTGPEPKANRLYSSLSLRSTLMLLKHVTEVLPIGLIALILAHRIDTSCCPIMTVTY